MDVPKGQLNNNTCYLCGFRESNPEHRHDKIIDKYFTESSKARSPQSECLCDFCRSTLSKGSESLLWYWHPTKKSWSKMFGRSLSRLYKVEINGTQRINTLLSSKIEGTHTEKGIELPLLHNMPTRPEIRGWLLNPPEPPFLINIAESGQKHTVIWALEGYHRDHFPVQFESDSLWIDRTKFTAQLNHYETLLGLGFSKSEIDTGDYRSDRLAVAYPQYLEHEEVVAPLRRSRWIDLLSYVGQKP